MHVESLPLAPVGTAIGVIVGSVLTQTATVAADPTSNLLLITVVAGSFTLMGAIANTAITGHFQGKTALAVALVASHAAEAAAAAKAAAEKADEVKEQTSVMSGQLDGKLDKMITALEAKAKAEGAAEERDRGEAKALEVAAQFKLDAATVRTEAKEDRQEVRDAAATSVPPVAESVTGTTRDPVHMIIANPDPVPVVETPITKGTTEKGTP